jgi:hypothetical protein
MGEAPELFDRELLEDAGKTFRVVLVRMSHHHAVDVIGPIMLPNVRSEIRAGARNAAVDNVDLPKLTDLVTDQKSVAAVRSKVDS